MAFLKCNVEHVLSFMSLDHIAAMESEAQAAKEKLFNKTGHGHDFLGWVDFADHMTDNDIDRILSASEKIRKQSEVLVVIGIGGSYLGAKAAIEMLTPYFSKSDFEVIFAGHTLSSTYANQLLAYLEDKSFSINVISKSGTTTEPAIAFRLIKALLEKKYGQDAEKRIFVTTDASSGALRQLTEEKKYESFIIPGDVGGRYSVLTAVGLLPIACCGIDIRQMISGAKAASAYFKKQSFFENEAMVYASVRNILYRQGKRVEIFASYEPKLHYLSEWLKQLFGESEGKEQKGIFPASVIYSTDLHSMGQYVQDGSRILFETIIDIAHPEEDITIPVMENDLDELNYLADKKIDYVNKQAMRGTLLAHVDGGVPNIIIEVDRIDAFCFGYMVYFFMFSCAISGYILDVNPFNQEGVEAYKKNMFALLGKKGYEKLLEVLKGKKTE